MSTNGPSLPVATGGDTSLNQCKRPPEQLDGITNNNVQNESNKRARTSAQAGTNSASYQNANSTASAYKSIVHLSVTKVEPSYTEPWRKKSPVSLEGTGFLVDIDGGKTTCQAATTDIFKTKSLRILTTASAVHHATSIRAYIAPSSSPLSVSCSVEWISLPLDLAMLKIETNDVNWVTLAHNACATITERLPEVGEHVTIAVKASNCSNTMHNVGHVSSYFADEDHHFMLRMQINASTDTCTGGIVVDRSGYIVGLMGSEAVCAIPNVVLHQFIEQCRDASAALSGSRVYQDGGTTSETDATPAVAVASETDNDSCHKNGCHKSHSDTTACQSDKEKSRSVTLQSKAASEQPKNCLPGISSLGITGYQTLENKALRKSFGLDNEGVDGVRITGVYHIAHSTANSSVDHNQTHCTGVVGHCNSSALRVDDILLSINNEPIMFNGSVKLCPGRENERIDFRWRASQCKSGTQVQLEVMRQKKRIQLTATLCEPRHLIPRLEEGRIDELPSYVIVGGCLFVPLSHAWIEESRKSNPNLPVSGYHRYLQEQRKGDQQLIILSKVLSDDVNMGYHGMENLLVTSVNGQRLTNMQHLVEVMLKSKQDATLEFRCSDVHAGRSKVVISMDCKEVMKSESSILSRHMMDAWCSPNALSTALKQESERKAHRHGVTCGLKTLRALRNAISETTIVVQKPKTADERVISHTKRILHLSEAHKMQSAPNFSGKYIEDVGWTQVKTKHLSQLCVCGKTTRFYCICSVGVMRCKDCFLKHCRDHMSNGEEGCDVCGDKTDLLAEGIDLVTSKKRKTNNPNQALQSRCVVCKAKTCLCCSECGGEPEVPLCDVTTGRNCLAIHISEQHSCKHKHNADAKMG